MTMPNLVPNLVCAETPELERPPGLADRPEMGGRPVVVERYGGTAQTLTETRALDYDAEGRCAKSMTWAPDLDGVRTEEVQLFYDAAGRLSRSLLVQRASVEDPWLRQDFVRHYDPRGRLVQLDLRDATAQVNGRVRWRWDDTWPVSRRMERGDGSLLHEARWIWVEGRISRWEHHAADEGLQWTIVPEWDDVGHLVAERHSRDGVTRYGYDEQGRLVEGAKHGADGTLIRRVRFSFGEDGRLREELAEHFDWPRPRSTVWRYRYSSAADQFVD